MVRSNSVMSRIGMPICVDVIDGLETENALTMVEKYGAFVQRSNEPACIKKLMTHAVLGNYKQFKSCVESMCTLAQQRVSTNGLSREVKSSLPLTLESLRRKMFDNILKVSYDKVEEITLLMFLSISHAREQKCEDIDHGYCRILEDIMKGASPSSIREQLMIRSSIDRTALHFAASTGQACQLANLLQSGIYLDSYDKSGRTPLHYAIERSSGVLVSLLLWCGADMSKSQLSRPRYAPRLISLSNSTTQQLGTYLDGRINYVQSKFMNWASEFCQQHFDLRGRPSSEIHCMRLCRDSDNLSVTACLSEDLQRTVCLDFRDTLHEDLLDDYNMSLFMFPVFYRPQTNSHESLSPELCRTDFFSSCQKVENVIAGRMLLKGEYIELFLESEINPEHNGYFYMYRLPNTLVPDTHELHFNLDLKRLSSEQLQSCFFLVGAIATRKKPTKQSSGAKNVQKTKTKCD